MHDAWSRPTLQTRVRSGISRRNRMNGSRVVGVGATPSCRCNSHHSTKYPTQVGLVGQSRCKCNLRQWFVTGPEERTNELNSPRQNIVEGRHTYAHLECPE